MTLKIFKVFRTQNSLKTNPLNQNTVTTTKKNEQKTFRQNNSKPT